MAAKKTPAKKTVFGSIPIPESTLPESVGYAQNLAKLIWENHKTPDCAILCAAVGGFTDAEFGEVSDQFNWGDNTRKMVGRHRVEFPKNPEEHAIRVQRLAKDAWKKYGTNDCAMLGALFGVFTRAKLDALSDRFDWPGDLCEAQQLLWIIEPGD